MEKVELRRQISFDSTMATFQIQLCEAYALNRASLTDVGDRLELKCLNSMLEYLELMTTVMLTVTSCTPTDPTSSLAGKKDPKETSSSVDRVESLEFSQKTEDFDLELSETAHRLKPSENKKT